MNLVPVSMAHRGVATVMALALYASAWLQLNDPDPVLWVLIYVVMGSLALLTVFSGVWRIACWLAFAGALGWAAWLFPSVVELFMHHPAGDLLTGMSPDRPYVEESRESLGLLIGVVAMAHLLLASRRPAD